MDVSGDSFRQLCAKRAKRVAAVFDQLRVSQLEAARAVASAIAIGSNGLGVVSRLDECDATVEFVRCRLA